MQYTSAAMDVYLRWYGFSPSHAMVNLSGYLLTLVGLMMALGFCRRVVYSIAALFFGVLLIGLTPHLLDPYGSHQEYWPNHAFIAQVPVLAGYIALCLFRSSDSYCLDNILPAKYPYGFLVGSKSDTPSAVSDIRAAYALLLIRIGSALFFFQWGIEKFVALEMSAGILERWYGVSSNAELFSIILGCFEILLALALLTGALQRITYGIAALVKLKTCWAIAALLFLPFATESGGRLSSVGPSIPLLAILCFLYAVRYWDVFSLDVRYRQNKNS